MVKNLILDILKQGSNCLFSAVLNWSNLIFYLTEVLALFCHPQLFV